MKYHDHGLWLMASIEIKLNLAIKGTKIVEGKTSSKLFPAKYSNAELTLSED